MDGTAKGGIVLSIKDQLNIPVKFIGLGEQVDDLQEFDLEQYIYGLCKGLVEEA
jgi:fused signal recognition particle receptor